MDPKHKADEPAASLRQRAEASARLEPPAEPELAPEAMRRALHELRVHQIELEMQNDELRRSHAELALSRARYFDLYDQAPVGYCSVSAEGRILESNRTAEGMLGADRGELVSQPFTRYIFSADQDLFYLHRQQAFREDATRLCDLRMVRRDGTVLWVRLTITAARIPWGLQEEASGGARVLRIVLGDISERKRLEGENARLEASLQEARKLETLGILAGGIAHDFNNLLTTILGNANMGALAAPPEGEMAAFFEAIEKASLRAADLTRQLLAYAGKGKLLVTGVDLGILVQEITLLLAASIPSRVTLRCDLADRLPLVKGDPDQLRQIVLNLITNAAEAFGSVPGQGLITVRTREEAVDAAGISDPRWLLPLSPGPYVTLEVADTGLGMSPEVEARAFDPFFTTKFTGRGLGLAAVIGSLRSHGGSMMVRTEPGQGASFKLYLPAAN